MDTMAIGTRFMQGILSKILKRVIRNNLGVGADISFNDKITMEYDEEGGVMLHVNADVYMERHEFEKLLDRV